MSKNIFDEDTMTKIRAMSTISKIVYFVVALVLFTLFIGSFMWFFHATLNSALAVQWSATRTSSVACLLYLGGIIFGTGVNSIKDISNKKVSD